MHHEWKRFVGAAAGTRFQQLHARKRRDGRRFTRRLLWWAMGVALIVAGFVMLFTPGPGILTLALGLACLAQESLPFARKCDRFELHLREVLQRRRARRKSKQ